MYFVWRTTAFAPDHGRTAVYLEADGKRTTRPVLGWLTQELIDMSNEPQSEDTTPDSDVYPDAKLGDVRVVGGVQNSEGEVWAVTQYRGFQEIRRPGRSASEF